MESLGQTYRGSPESVDWELRYTCTGWDYLTVAREWYLWSSMHSRDVRMLEDLGISVARPWIYQASSWDTRNSDLKVLEVNLNEI